MEFPPYRVLSAYYDDAWNAFCRNYVDILRIGRTYRPASVLDLGCGTGELLTHIAKALPASRLVGVDISPDMCARATRRVPTAEIVHGDMRTVALDHRFELVTCTHDAVNYLTDDGALDRFAARVAGHTAPDGTFAFDFATPAYFETINKDAQWTATRTGSVRQTTTFDHLSSIATTRFLFPDGSFETHHQRAFDEEEIGEALFRHGFRDIEEFEVTADDVPAGTLVWTAILSSDGGRRALRQNRL